MITPTVTEIRRDFEPVTRDPFIDGLSLGNGNAERLRPAARGAGARQRRQRRLVRAPGPVTP